MRVGFLLLGLLPSLLGACGIDNGLRPDADGTPIYVDTAGACAGMEAAPAAIVSSAPACIAPDPVADPWSIEAFWTFAAPVEAPDATYAIGQPAVARLTDDNGDGTLGHGDSVYVVAVLYAASTDSADGALGPGWLVAIDGATGAEAWALPDVDPRSGVAIADVDNDGAVEILCWSVDGHLVARDATGATVWTSSDAAPPAEDGYQMIIADVDEDGIPEVIADVMVLDGVTGALRATLPVDTVTHQHRAPSVGDITGDGAQEIMVAGRVFSADGVQIWYSGEGVEDTVWSTFLQLDTDDAAEVLTLGANLVLSDDDGTTLLRSPTFARNWSGGPCIGNFDGDDDTEMAYGAYDGFYVRDMDVRNVSSAIIHQYDGAAACAGYDLDADGILEVIFADEVATYILDGSTGAERFNVPRSAQTGFASPAIADLDDDGDVEILVVASDTETPMALTVWTHAGEGWPAVTDAWPTFDYDGHNVAIDGRVPAIPTANWLQESGVRAAPTNLRMGAAADLVVTFTEVCDPACEAEPTPTDPSGDPSADLSVAVQVANVGAAEAPAGSVLALYAVDGRSRRLIARQTLEAVPAGAALPGALFEVAAASELQAVVEAADHECDATNNTATWRASCW